MKPSRTFSYFLSAIIALFLSSSPGWAFHDGGVAECEGCHSMHNSLNGTTMSGASPRFEVKPYLLQGSTQSSTCLICHQQSSDTGPNSFHVSTPGLEMPVGVPPKQLTPAGDFGWLKKSYSWISNEDGQAMQSKGDRHGHNIVAPDFGYNADASQITAPGGVSGYPASQLQCSSCHDPHGRYRLMTNPAPVIASQPTTGKPIYDSGSYGALPTATLAVGTYRLLAGKNFQPKSMPAEYKFNYPAPYAVAPTDYNRSEASGETRVAYGKGMANWCSNCHEAMNGSILGNHVHPADQALGPIIAPLYNQYKKTGDMTGLSGGAYTSLVPFTLDGTGDLVTLKNSLGSTAGPVSSDRVMCLSCHRAHASGWDSMMRYNVNSTFMTVAALDGTPEYPGTDNSNSNADTAQGRTMAETRMAYYDRPANKFASWQRVYCNKCHAQD